MQRDVFFLMANVILKLLFTIPNLVVVLAPRYKKAGIDKQW